MSKETINIVTISGSLRPQSSNSAILKAITQFAPGNIHFINYTGLADLPHFNPDIDVEPMPPAVTAFRQLLNKADGVIICTPEYAFGPPGSLKNALDWTVSSGEFTKKPVALISASPLYGGGDKAHASLMLTLKALDTIVAEKCKLSIPAVYKKFNEQGELTDEEIATALKNALDGLLESISTKEKETTSL